MIEFRLEPRQVERLDQRRQDLLCKTRALIRKIDQHGTGIGNPGLYSEDYMSPQELQKAREASNIFVRKAFGKAGITIR